jgi:hypothetical protein
VADIAITCSQCSTITTVSEFADSGKLQCRECGKQLEKPGALATALAKHEQLEKGSPSPAKKSGLRLANRKHATPPPEDEPTVDKPIIPPPDPINQRDTLELRPEIKDDKRRINHAAVAGSIFVVLGSAMGYLRYGGVLPPDVIAMTTEYGWLVVVAFHVMIVLKAMTDSMLQGILCLLVPGYSLFYLFGVSDDFYLRAILAGVLVGIGQDAAIKLSGYAAQAGDVVHSFIAGGGGDIR